MEKVYVVARGDLNPGATCAQSCHALSAFAADFPAAHAEWHKRGQNLVVLQIRGSRGCPTASRGASSPAQ